MAEVTETNNEAKFLLEFREFKGEVNTKLDRALEDIKELKEGTTDKITRLEEGKADKSAIVEVKSGIDAHDVRLRALENWRWYLLGAIGIVGVVFYTFLAPYFKEMNAAQRSIEQSIERLNTLHEAEK